MQYENILFWINTAGLIISDFFILILIYSAFHENQRRAWYFGLVFLLINSAFWLVMIFFIDIQMAAVLNVLFMILIFIFMLISLARWFPARSAEKQTPTQLFDERDHMFARNNLQLHSDLFEKYYSIHPELKAVDEKIHKLPELLEPGSIYYDRIFAPLGIAHDTVTTAGKHAADFPVAHERVETDPKEISEIICRIAKYHGAVDAGITKTKPYQFYSHAGRQADDWGTEIKNTHPYAIAIIVAMDTAMIGHAPKLPMILESTRQYIEAAKIAHILANYIKGLGYDARAHFDGQYEVACVPVALDAGLGELGRLGLLIHPDYGPCVRISVVTTEMKLFESKNTAHHIGDFCRICKKCADNCPTNAIAYAEMPESRGFKHWHINMENCYTFWKRSGTDCGICLRVCPYTKPNTLFHKMARFYVSRNPVNQRVALFFDDLLYGRKIKISKKNPTYDQMIV